MKRGKVVFMKTKAIAAGLVLILAALCLGGCSSGVNIEGTWVLEGFYASEQADEELKGSDLLSGEGSMNEFFLSGLITQTTTFSKGVATITTSGAGHSQSGTHAYTLKGNQLTYEDEEGVYTVRIEGDQLFMVKDILELRYHRQK